MMRRTPILTVLLIAGCGSAPTPTSTAPDPQQQADARRWQELHHCQEGLAKLLDPTTPVGEAATIIASYCAPMYHEAACSDAIANLPSVADDRPLAVLHEKCAPAYCDKLNIPKPTACSTPPEGDGIETWEELHRAILAYELQLPVDAPLIDAIAGDRNAGVSVDLPAPAEADIPTLDVEMVIKDQKLHLTVSGKTEFVLPTVINANHLVPMVQAIEEASPPPDARALLAIDEAVPHGSVVAVLDAIKQAGIQKIAFAVAPEPGPPDATP